MDKGKILYSGRLTDMEGSETQSLEQIFSNIVDVIHNSPPSDASGKIGRELLL